MRWDILFVCKASVKKQRVTSKCCRSDLCSLKCSMSESTVTKDIYQALQEYSGGRHIHGIMVSLSHPCLFFRIKKLLIYFLKSLN